MQRKLPPWMKRRGELQRSPLRRLFVRQFTPESDEHVETADDAPSDALLVVSNGAPKLAAFREAELSKAKAGLEAAKDREARSEGDGEIVKAKAEQERFIAEIDLHSRPLTTTVRFMFRLRAGTLSDGSRLERAMLVPGEGDPIPLKFSGGTAGRGVLMTAEVEVNTTVYVALHLVGLAGSEVEVLLMSGGSAMSVLA
jgi:hypothetical protein